MYGVFGPRSPRIAHGRADSRSPPTLVSALPELKFYDFACVNDIYSTVRMLLNILTAIVLLKSVVLHDLLVDAQEAPGSMIFF